MLQRCQNQFGTPGKSSPAIFAFDMPKASLGSFTKAMDPGTTMPSWRSGNTHGFCGLALRIAFPTARRCGCSVRRWGRLGLIEKLFKRFSRHLEAKGYIRSE